MQLYSSNVIHSIQFSPHRNSPTCMYIIIHIHTHIISASLKLVNICTEIQYSSMNLSCESSSREVISRQLVSYTQSTALSRHHELKENDNEGSLISLFTEQGRGPALHHTHYSHPEFSCEGYHVTSPLACTT